MRDRDDELCLCFHVTRRKVENFLRVEKPRRVSQISECFGAGTGCGWCRPFLQKLYDAHVAGQDAEFPDATTYAAQRADYRQKKKGEERAPGDADDRPASES